MLGQIRVTLLDRALTLGSFLARAGRAAITAATFLPRWRPTDIYAAAKTARFYAAHGLIEQAAAQVDDDTVLDAARTWPWFGADFVHYEETD